MRMSCNGCRVLRKGCSESCSIRPCLQWIKSPEAQANATVFLAKFYGRAGLMNLINAGPGHLGPAIFRSLLYEACGRIVNPIYGSVGLLWSGNWAMCQAAVEAVLKGAPVVQIPSETAAAAPAPPLKAYDIRHVHASKDQDAAAAADLHRVARSGRTSFKRAAAARPKPKSGSRPQRRPEEAEPERAGDSEEAFHRAPSHESSASHGSEHHDHLEVEEARGDAEGRELSVDTVEAGSHVSQGEQSAAHGGQSGDGEEVGLELTLGLEPASSADRPARPAAEARCDLSGWSSDSGHFSLRLELPA